MAVETLRCDLNDELLKSVPVVDSATFPCNRTDDDLLPDLKSEEIDSIELEENLAEFVWHDDSTRLISLSHQISAKASEKEDFEENRARIPQDLVDRHIPSRLLHLACQLDSVECASALLNGECALVAHVSDLDGKGRTPLHNAAKAHSVRCIELLLRKSARTDFRSKNGDARIPLEVALSNKRLLLDWTPNETVEKLLVLLGQRDLSAVRLLMERTTEAQKVAYNTAMEGSVVALTVLLMVDADRVNVPMLLPRETGSVSKVETTIYECVVRESIVLCQMEDGDVELNSCGENTDSSVSRGEKRKAMLCEMELLQLFGAVVRGSYTDRRMASPLISACEVGDEAVVKLLLTTKIDVNDTDRDGNSALHWCLRANPYSKDSRFRLVCLLLRHGARVSQKNKLGLTPLHVAAGNGNIQALQLLLLRDPNCVNVASETEDTPLFFAVKSNSTECVQVLLSYGANTKSLNLRKERPIDLAKSQDMRFVLLNPANISFWKRPIPIQETASLWPTHDSSDADVCHGFLDMKQAIISERFTIPKTELCRYYESPSGCVRGTKCYFAHGEAELRRTKSGPMEIKLELPYQPINRKLSKHPARFSEDLNRKIFIGGLPPSVDSDDLRDYFEKEFGAVEDSIVIGSQAGDHMQSRGFGFVTFKTEESVAAAVQAHYINVLGKKVEIKGAIPKAALLTEFPKPCRQQKQQQEHQEPLNSSAKEPPTYEGRQGSMSWAERLNVGGPRTLNLDMQVDLTPVNLPPWVETFKRWLPSFLQEVSQRLGEGEWYPLSSLKGDFRATCGLELDHTSLGYLKLSDFMRSFPRICRMKVVPVGKGPATHMVLLPFLFQSQNQLHSQTQNLVKEVYIPWKPKPYYDYVPFPQVGIRGHVYPSPCRYELDDDNERYLARTLSATFHNVECAGSGDVGGFGGQGASDVNKNLLLFLKPGHSFLRPLDTPPENADGEGKEPQPCSGDDKKAPFSYFVHQFDFWKNLRENKGSVSAAANDEPTGRRSEDTRQSICMLCKVRIAIWTLLPCRHKVLCRTCKSAQNLTLCLCCQGPVQDFLLEPWGDMKQDGQNQSSISPVLNDESNLTFPPLPSRDSSQKSQGTKVPKFCRGKPSTSPGEEGASSTEGGGTNYNICVVCKQKATWFNTPCGHEFCNDCKSGEGTTLSKCEFCPKKTKSVERLLC